MEQKELIGFTLLTAGIVCGITLTSLSERLRILAFVLMIALAVLTDRLQMNFVSREWYRGTTRGFEVSIVDILAISILSSSILFPRPGRSRWYWPAGWGPMLLFFSYCCFSVAISDPQLFGMFELSKMLRGMLVFLATAMFVRSEEDVRLMILTLGCVVCYEGITALNQRYLHRYFRVPGTLGDPNSLSMFLCMTTPIYVATLNSDLPRFLRRLSVVAIGLGVIGIVLTISRTGIASLVLLLLGATLVCVSFRFTTRQAATALIVFGLAIGVAAKSWRTLESRFKDTQLASEYGDIHHQGRGYYIALAKMIVEDRFLGVGLNNWSYWVSNRYGPQLGFFFVSYRSVDKPPDSRVPPGRDNLDAAQAAPAHNLAALTAGELGIPGLLIFLIVWFRWFQIGQQYLWRRTRAPMWRVGTGLFFALCGIFLQSLTEWVYHQTQIFYTFNILMGVLASLHHSRAASQPISLRPVARAASDELEFDIVRVCPRRC